MTPHRYPNFWQGLVWVGASIKLLPRRRRRSHPFLRSPWCVFSSNKPSVVVVGIVVRLNGEVRAPVELARLFLFSLNSIVHYYFGRTSKKRSQNQNL